MKFYDREQEIAFLRETRDTAEKAARFTMVTGRRRIGKTTLIREAYKDEPFVYFFVARKAESDLCEAYLEEINEKLGIPTLGSSRHFSEIFRYLMQLSLTRSFTLVIDEFQDFFRVNKAVYSEMQDIWDRYEKTSKINLVVCGSIYSLMQKIFKQKKEPLYGRQTAELRVKAFKQASVFCLPSYAEGFPMAVLDAWAYGLPVVTTPVGGIPDVAVDSENMLLFNPGDIDTLAERLDLLMSDDILRDKLAASSIKMSLEMFNLNTITKQVGEIYESFR